MTHSPRLSFHLFVALTLALVPLSVVPTAAASSPSSCSFSGDYGSCAFSCTPGSVIVVTAFDPQAGHFPRTHATCGGVSFYCQASEACAGEGGPTPGGGEGLCYSETISNRGSCATLPPDAGAPPHLPGTDVDQTVPAQGVSRSVGPLSTPTVPSESVPVPAVDAPATCTVSVCTAATSIPSENLGSTPDVPAQSTPNVSQCDPTHTLCAIQGPIPLTPEVPPQGPITTPGETVPALCATPAAAACLPAQEILPARTVTTPGLGPIVLVPATSVDVSTSDVDVAFHSNLDQTQTLPPTDVGPVHLCDAPPSGVCQAVPTLPEAGADGSLTVGAAVGSTTVGHTFVLP
ncbi:MAG: hypothetical protein QOE90_2617 [Thermoplasmata archaeon]|jgi:hypothetical protein|nr:hypothetical protein [Thermoplasmata archaeon]